MQKRLLLLISSLFLMISGSAYAHSGSFSHPDTGIGLVHGFMHIMMLLPLAAGVFFLSRWWLRRNQSATKILPVNKR